MTNVMAPHRAAWLALLTLLLWALPAFAQDSVAPTREAIFLLDRSQSMTQARKGVSFEQALAGTRSEARRQLEYLACFEPQTVVRFFTFGEKDKHTAFDASSGAGAVGMTPVQALAALDGFFTERPSAYGDGRTYIRYSIFQVVRELLGLPESYRPDQALPDGDRVLHIYVFSDGAEDLVPSGSDVAVKARAWKTYVEPYDQWAVTQHESGRLRWFTWTVYEDFPREGADRLSYQLRLGRPTDAVKINLQDQPKDGRQPVGGVYDRLWLVPDSVSLGWEAYVDRHQDDHPLQQMVCQPEDWDHPSPLTDSPESWGDVGASVQWGASPAEANAGIWPVHLPARSVGGECVDGTALQGVIPRRSVALEIDTSKAAVTIPVPAPAVGSYPLELDRAGLCAALLESYPNSRFLLPVAHLGNVLVDSWVPRPKRHFSLSARGGSAPDAPLDPLVADRFHVYRAMTELGEQAPQARRTLQLTTQEQAVPLTWSVTGVRHRAHEQAAPQPVRDAQDIVVLDAGAAGRGSLLEAVSAEQPVTLLAPAEPQRWWPSQLGSGFSRSPGLYEIEVCAAPQLIDNQDYDLILECPGCVGELASGRDAACVTLTLPVERRPLWWIWCLLILLGMVTAAWAWFRWATRLRFPPGFVIGGPYRGQNLREQQNAFWANMFWRRPYYLAIGGGTPMLLQQNSRAPETETVLVLLPTSRSTMKVWCWQSGTESDPRGEQVRVTWSRATAGSFLPVRRQSTPPTGAGEAWVIRYRAATGEKIRVYRQDIAHPERSENSLGEFVIHNEDSASGLGGSKIS